jgi:hypothetical protein
MSRKALELSEPEIMYCFAYGAHFVAPIIIDGERKATMYAGQFRPDKFSPEQLKELEKIAVEIDLDPACGRRRCGPGSFTLVLPNSEGYCGTWRAGS